MECHISGGEHDGRPEPRHERGSDTGTARNPGGSGSSTASGGGVAFTPMSASGKKRVKLIGVLVGVLVVLAIAGVVAITVVNTSRTPEAQVRKYLDLLAAGKGTEATEMVDPGVRNDQRVFLTDEAMASATSLLVVEDGGRRHKRRGLQHRRGHRDHDGRRPTLHPHLHCDSG